MRQFKKAIRTEFTDYEEACRFVALYAGFNYGNEAYRALKDTVPGYADILNGDDAFEAAVQFIAARNNIKLPAEPAPVEPTYTTSTGNTYRVSEMWPEFIRNALRKYPGMPLGLRSALLAELEK